MCCANIYTSGQLYVRGLADDLTIQNHNITDDPDLFLPYLQPETLRWWHKLNAFWYEGTPLSYDNDNFTTG